MGDYRKRVERWGVSLEALINDPLGLPEFKRFLESVHCPETLEFCLEVNEYKTLGIVDESKCQEIYTKYISYESPKEVNISAKLKTAIVENLNNPSLTIFDDAALYIHTKLLATECYPRFIRSEHYRSLLDKGDNNVEDQKFNKKVKSETHKRFFSISKIKKGSPSSVCEATVPQLSPVNSSEVKDNNGMNKYGGVYMGSGGEDDRDINRCANGVQSDIEVEDNTPRIFYNDDDTDDDEKKPGCLLSCLLCWYCCKSGNNPRNEQINIARDMAFQIQQD